MKKAKFVALLILLITVLLLLCSCTKFHFITDPKKLDWGINHYYVPSGSFDNDGNPQYILYSHETTFINPFYTAKITDTTLNFGEENTVTFVDLNGNVHKGTYTVEKYSENYYDHIVMNFDDGVSINSDYFRLRRDKEYNNYIVFEYDDVEYVFSTMHALGEEEIVQKRYEMVEWARKINTGYKLTEEEKDLDFFRIKSVSLVGYPLKYRNHTLIPSISPSIMRQRQDGSGEFYCEIKGKTDGFWLNDFERYVFILVDKNNNIKEIEEPIPGNCLCVRASSMYYFYFFE